MTTNHRSIWNRSAIVLMAAAMALVGCGRVERIETPTFPARTSTTPPPAPDKYAFATFKTCEEIQQKVPELPPAPVEFERGEASNQFTQECEFTNSKIDGVYFTFRVVAYGNKQDRYGFHSGTEIAKTAFSITPQPEAEKDATANIGSDARWAISNPDVACKLEVLDENAILLIRYQERGSNSRSEHCRQGARDVARKIYAAVQPQ